MIVNHYADMNGRKLGKHACGCAGSIVPGSTFAAEGYADQLSVPRLSGLASNQQVLPSGAFNPMAPSPDRSSYPRPGSYGTQGLPLQARPELIGMPEVNHAAFLPGLSLCTC